MGIVHGVVFIEDVDDLAVKVLNLCCVLVSLRPNSGLPCNPSASHIPCYILIINFRKCFSSELCSG